MALAHFGAQHVIRYLARISLLMSLVLVAVQAGESALLVVGSPTLSAGDTVLRNRLQTLGYTVTAVDDDVASSGSAAGMALIVVSESVETGTGIGTVFTNVAVPLITGESGIYAPLKMTGATLNTDYGTVAAQTQVTIVDATHPLAAGLSGTVTVVTSADLLDFGVPSAAANKVATLVGQPGKFSIFGYETGAAMVGMNAPARRVAWFAEDVVATKLTASGLALFDAAVAWAKGGTTGVPPGGTDGPGVPKQTFAAGDVYLDNNVRELARIAVPPANGTPGYGHGRVSMIGGYLFVPFFTEEGGASGGGFDMYRLTTGSGGTIPASATSNAPTLTPALRRNRPSSGPAIREAHAYGLAWVNGKRMLVMQATNGIEIWDFTAPLSPILVRNFSISGMNGSGDTSGYAGAWWVSLQWPYAYIGGNAAGLRIVDLSDPANPVLRTSMPTSSLGGFTVGSVHAMGNLLIVTSNVQSNATESTLGGGYSFFDISNPITPVTLATYPTSPATWPKGYSSMLNGNRLLIGGANSSFQMIDVNNPLSIVKFPALNGPGPGGYINFQDGFAHSGYQTHAIKVNTTGANATTAPVLTRKGTIAVVSTDTGDLNFAMPLGNMLFAANDRLGKGSALLVHDAAPDNNGPVVNMVQPKAGATGQSLSTRVGLTFTDELADNTLTTANITLRQQGTTTALAGTLSYQMNMVNFTPASPLVAGTTYEIVVRANGIADVSGNTSGSSFSSTFTTTGAIVTPLSIAIVKPNPVTLGTGANFSVATASGVAPLQYAWNFGNGVTTGFSNTSSAAHTYSGPGHYSVRATVRDNTGATATSQLEIQVVYVAPTASAPASSGPLGLLPSLNRLYAVNPDADTVTVIDTSSNTKVAEIAVGKHPRALAVRTADNTVWVANQDSATVSVISASTNTVVATVAMPRASQPSGIAVAPNQAAVYVSLSATGQLAKVDPASRSIVGTPVAVGPTPRAVAVSHDSNRILVTRFISSDAQGEVVEVNASTMALTRTFALPVDTTTVDDERQARGVANYLAGVAISPDGSVAWVPSKKDNIKRGTNRDGQSLNFQNTVRAIISHLNLSTGTAAELIDINDMDSPSAVAFTPRGDLAFVATQGTNTVHLVDVYSNTTQFFPVGLAPQGLAVNAAGTRLYVQNFMARTVGVYDITGMTSFTTGQATLLATIATVTTEKLTPAVLAGKQFFYDASTRRMNSDGYISCATCHVDGGHDGRVWDFSDRGEGLRRTVDLRGRSGVGHGPAHWSGNFDEIQDFEHDIRGPFAGSGFMSDADFNTGTRNTTLGLAKAGVSPDLDRLAAYLSSLSAVPASPLRNQDGTLTAAATRGQALFIANNCATCHSGPRLTDSALNRFHDVGTITQPTSGKRLGATLTGIDTPTLKGLWNTERYLHDGSQSTLAGIFQVDDPTTGVATHKVVTTMSGADQTDLFAYLRQIDEGETPAYLPQGSDNVVVIEAEAFTAVQAPIGQAHSWIPVINGTTYANTIAIQALPNSGSVPTSNLNSTSPRADYLVQFPAAGTYTVWVCGFGSTTADNSVFVGANAIAPASTAGVILPAANGWAKSPDTITVAAGRQTITLWMREDGVVVDRILLTTNATMPAPTGLGPNESGTTLSGNAPASAPVITTQPANQSVAAGQTATFTVVATGTGPLTYVWKRGTTVVGGNSATLSLSNVQTADAGSYTGTVSNSIGTVTSAAATLTVNASVVAPTITTQPVSQTVTVGQTATFTVVAGGTGPLTYVWKRGTTVVGGNSATLSLSNVQTADAGSYTCTVSNSAGTVTSAAATLTVNPPVADSFQQDSGSDGLVVIEAETTLVTRIAAGGKSWQTVTTPAGFSGSGAIQALANTGVTVALANLSNSPRVDYRITFTKTGTHYVWIRGLGATGADNSVTIGIDGVATTTSDNLSLPTTYGWNNTNLTPPGGTIRTITVASVGLHTLNVWMREDGVVVDKVLLTVNAGLIPSGTGPGESPLVGGNPTPPVLPTPWVTTVIGDATPVGSASAVNEVFTISGSGADIWGTVDAFRAVSQPVTGNCDLIARVDSLQNTNPWAKAGVMLRSSLQDNAAHAMTVATVSNGISFQHRIAAGAASNFVAGPLVSAPRWVKLSRRGEVFSSYESANGTTWTFIGSQTISMPSVIQACLVVTSHQPGVLCTAVISQVSVVPVVSN